MDIVPQHGWLALQKNAKGFVPGQDATECGREHFASIGIADEDVLPGAEEVRGRASIGTVVLIARSPVCGEDMAAGEVPEPHQVDPRGATHEVDNPEDDAQYM